MSEPPSSLSLMGSDFGAGLDSAAFAEMMTVMQTQPPGVAMLHIATHPGMGPAARLVFAPLILETIEEVDVVQGWLFVAALFIIMEGANAAGVTLRDKEKWFGAWDRAFAYFGRDDLWAAGTDALRGRLLLLLHNMILHFNQVPEQLLVDYDKWRGRIASLEDPAFRDAISLILRDELVRRGYIS